MPTLVCLGDSITAKEKDPNGMLKLTPRLQHILSDWTIINQNLFLFMISLVTYSQLPFMTLFSYKFCIAILVDKN